MQNDILIKRKAIEQIEKWYSSKNRKCLLITGARQVGKTFLIREFLKPSGSDFLELNFLNNELAKDAFETSKSLLPLLPPKVITCQRKSCSYQGGKEIYDLRKNTSP